MTLVACCTSKENALHATKAAYLVAYFCCATNNATTLARDGVLVLARAREKVSCATPYFCSVLHIPIGNATRNTSDPSPIGLVKPPSFGGDSALILRPSSMIKAKDIE
jgi:hypothetical protein